MKQFKFIAILLIFAVIAIKANSQSTHNYFTSDIYPGLYAQITFGNNFILFNIPPNANTRLNYAYKKNNDLYYANRDFVVAISSNGAYMSTTLNGKAVRFSYVGPVNPQSNSYNGSGQNENSTRRDKCYFCNGTGKVVKNDHIPQYGGNDYYVYKKCGECGLEYNSTITNHYHATCPKCFGKGFIER